MLSEAALRLFIDAEEQGVGRCAHGLGEEKRGKGGRRQKYSKSEKGQIDYESFVRIRSRACLRRRRLEV